MIHSILQRKTKTPRALCSNIVYQFRCLGDTNFTYVGMTNRHLAARACKHLVLVGPHKSAIKDHICTCATVHRKLFPDFKKMPWGQFMLNLYLFCEMSPMF